MRTADVVLLARGAVKDYDWGIVDGLAPWTGARTGSPQAELWFGVHPGGPSPLVDASGAATGENLGDHFDIEAIPLLVKILAAARPLSFQVHPVRSEALRGWAEQLRGGPTIYSDPFEKTEMLVALEPFDAFAGWRSLAGTAAILDSVPGAQRAVAALETGDRAAAIRSLLSRGSTDDVAAQVAALPAAARSAGLDEHGVAAYETVAECYPDDPGAVLSALLADIRLEPGQAVYLPAGVPHSYIRGIGLEVMTSSDNVLRLGLTSKPVFVDQALAALVMDKQPQVLPTRHGEVIWPVNAPFVVRMLAQGSERIPTGAYRIVVLIEGSGVVESDFGEVVLRAGTAAVISADDPDTVVRADGLVAIVQSTEVGSESALEY